MISIPLLPLESTDSLGNFGDGNKPKTIANRDQKIRRIPSRTMLRLRARFLLALECARSFSCHGRAPVPAFILATEVGAARIPPHGGAGLRRLYVWLVSFVWQPSKRGFPQASGVTLTNSCRRNNSSGDDFAGHLRLAGLVKLLAGSFERFTHYRNHLRFERSRSYEWTNWHDRYPPQHIPANLLIPHHRGVNVGQRAEADYAR